MEFCIVQGSDPEAEKLRETARNAREGSSPWPKLVGEPHSYRNGIATSGPRAVLLADRIALRMLDLYSYLQGYRFRPASSDEEIEQALHLRWKVYAAAGYITADHFPERRFADCYDGASKLFLAFYHDDCIGTLPLTDIRGGAPIFDLFNIPAGSQTTGRIVEMGRFAVDRKHCDVARAASLGLIRIAYAYSVTNGIDAWIGYAPTALLRSFRGFVTYSTLAQDPPLERHILARNKMPGYFEKHGDRIKTFRIDIGAISPHKGLAALWPRFLGNGGRRSSDRKGVLSSQVSHPASLRF